MDIEEVAEKTPEKIIRVPISPTMGLRHHHSRRVAFELGFEGDQVKQFARILNGLYKMFWEKNAMLVEINPLITTPEGDHRGTRCQVSFDGNATFQHPDIMQLRDLNEEDPKEVEASKYNLSYIALDGNIACLVNGAGLAMATMDIIKSFGGEPANFLDVGGGANEDQVTAAFKIILSDPNVEGILVNIFGGIMRCDVIARGIVAAAKNVEIKVPSSFASKAPMLKQESKSSARAVSRSHLPTASCKPLRSSPAKSRATPKRSTRFTFKRPIQ